MPSFFEVIKYCRSLYVPSINLFVSISKGFRDVF